MSPVTCHYQQQPQAQARTLPLLVPPLCTVWCCCWSWPRSINNEWQKPKNTQKNSVILDTFLARVSKSHKWRSMVTRALYNIVHESVYICLHNSGFRACHKKAASVTDSLCLSQNYVTITESLCLSHRVGVSQRQAVSFTDSLCLSETVCVCPLQPVSATDSLCWSEIVCVSEAVCFFSHIQSMSVTERLCLSPKVCVCHLQSVSATASLHNTASLQKYDPYTTMPPYTTLHWLPTQHWTTKHYTTIHYTT